MKYVTDDLLAMLYARAEALVYRRLFMKIRIAAAGSHVLRVSGHSFRHPAAPRLCAESALYVNPHNPEEIAAPCSLCWKTRTSAAN